MSGRSIAAVWAFIFLPPIVVAAGMAAFQTMRDNGHRIDLLRQEVEQLQHRVYELEYHNGRP